MSELAPRMRVLHHKVRNLLQERDRLATDRRQADEELRELKRNASVLQARIVELEREIEVLRASKPHVAVVERLHERLQGKPGVDLIARFGAELHACGMDEAALAASVRAVADEPGYAAEAIDAGLEEVFIHLMAQSPDNMA